MLELPLIEPGVEGTGVALTVVELLAVQPLASVTVTE